MKSMTGYGYRERGGEKFYFTVEVKSYNNRFLDLYVNLPVSLTPLEPRIREYLNQRIERGKVEAYIKLKELQEETIVTVDPGVVKGYLQALRTLASYTDAPEEIRLSHLLRIEGILKVDKSRDLEEYWKELFPLLEETCAIYDESRLREGQALAQDIERLLNRIEEELSQVEQYLPEIEKFYTETIRNRMKELLEDRVDESRIVTEVALLLVKYSITEEIVRLRSHIAGFRDTACQEGGIGKRLDFLCQEMNREINTIGSKNILAQITRCVVNMKDALEDIREQIRNIE